MTDNHDIAVPVPQDETLDETLARNTVPGIPLPPDIVAAIIAGGDVPSQSAAPPDIARWFFSASGDPRRGGTFDPLRRRFSHRLEGVSDTELERARAVVVGFMRALDENDTDAIRALSDFYPVFFQIDKMQDAIPRACSAMQYLLHRFEREPRTDVTQEQRLAADTSDAAWLLFSSLVALDDGFSRVGAEPLATEARSYVTRRADTKNDGRSLKGPRRLLAWAMARGGAFGATSEDVAMGKIEKAFERNSGKK